MKKPGTLLEYGLIGAVVAVAMIAAVVATGGDMDTLLRVFDMVLGGG